MSGPAGEPQTSGPTTARTFEIRTLSAAEARRRRRPAPTQRIDQSLPRHLLQPVQHQVPEQHPALPARQHMIDPPAVQLSCERAAQLHGW